MVIRLHLVSFLALNKINSFDPFSKNDLRAFLKSSKTGAWDFDNPDTMANRSGSNFKSLISKILSCFNLPSIPKKIFPIFEKPQSKQNFFQISKAIKALAGFL